MRLASAVQAALCRDAAFSDHRRPHWMSLRHGGGRQPLNNHWRFQPSRRMCNGHPGSKLGPCLIAWQHQTESRDRWKGRRRWAFHERHARHAMRGFVMNQASALNYRQAQLRHLDFYHEALQSRLRAQLAPAQHVPLSARIVGLRRLQIRWPAIRRSLGWRAVRA